MAIENSLAGSLLKNYTLLDEYPVQVAGEVFLRIRQNLLALPGKKLDALSEVHSHPMALAQCENFLHRQPQLKLVESEDTAMSAELIANEKLGQRAAIASTLAAELFGLEVIAPGIENNPQNYTRFLLIEKQGAKREGRKASLSIVLDHRPGALYQLLATAEKAGLNLTKIQSMPIVGTPWHYRFYIDVEREGQMDAGWLKHIFESSCAQLAILGVYAPGQHHEA
jgi:prephenate dehydratase